MKTLIFTSVKNIVDSTLTGDAGMKSISDYLNDLKEKTGSDYKSSILLGIDRSALSIIRKRNQVGDETAIKIAKAIGIDEAEVLLANAAARSNGEVKKVWEKISRLAGIAASFLVLFQIVSYPFLKLTDLVCILCQIMQKVQILHMARFLIDGFPNVKEMSHVKN